MIRWALAEIRRLETPIPRRRRPSISSSRTFGSRTTPLPITQILSEWRTPEGIRWNLKSSPSRPIGWPALLPPWTRTPIAAFAASRSVTWPLPSAPHWAPTITTPGMTRGLGRLGWRPWLRAGLDPPVGAEQRQRVAADLDQARDRTRPDLLLELGLVEVGGDDD